MSRHGNCHNCGAPLVKGRPYKTHRDGWGLSYWKTDLVCGRAHDSISGALSCYFNALGQVEKEMYEPSPLWDTLLEKSEGKGWKGGTMVVPFSNKE